jgi:hypothetical protein
MTTKEVAKTHKAVPFRPFRLHLAGGRSLAVRHPEMMAYAPDSRTAVVYKQDGDFEIVDLLLIESIEVAAGGGGRRNSRHAA